MAQSDLARDPIIPGMHPDPTICRTDRGYYLAASSFEYSPGIPLWHSPDLLTWSLVGNVLTRDKQFVSGGSAASRGIWAPTLRYRGGVFWLVTTNGEDPQGGQRIFHAKDPEGPWSDGTAFPEIVGIDPDLAWDDDGTCYLTYCAWSDTEIGIKQAVVDLERGTVIEDPRWIWHGTGLAHPEGPHLYQRGDWWYLVIAEGGTERGHVVSVARSRSPRGPFTAHPNNPVFTRRSTRHPVQNAGHADLVEREDSTWAAVYLGARPTGGSPRYNVNGRETFLTDVAWNDGWPYFAAEPGTGVHADTGFTDSFDADILHPRWISPGKRPADFTRRLADGLELRPVQSVEQTALVVRVPALSWTSRFTFHTVNGAAVAGVRIDNRHWYGLRIGNGRLQPVSRVGEIEAQVGSALPYDGALAHAIVRTASPSSGGPDDIEIGVHVNGADVILARLDGRYLSTEVAGGFTGRTVGAWALTGSAVISEAAVRPIF